MARFLFSTGFLLQLSYCKATGEVNKFVKEICVHYLFRVFAILVHKDNIFSPLMEKCKMYFFPLRFQIQENLYRISFYKLIND